MKNLIFQLQQFFKPWPEPGSWAYRFQMWKFNLPIYKVQIKFVKRKVIDEYYQESFLDIPAYLRRINRYSGVDYAAADDDSGGESVISKSSEPNAKGVDGQGDSWSPDSSSR